MSTISLNADAVTHRKWKGALFQVFFVFTLLLTVPLDPAYYRQLFSINWLHPNFQDLFQLTHAVPTLFAKAQWGWASFAGWATALGVSVIISTVWMVLNKGVVANTEELSYWLRVVLRYRLAIALLGFGVIKLIPVQLPGPSISDLNTPYGDFFPWKLYYLSTGVASAYYEPTLGAIEIFAALLLLSRRTAVIGAGIAASLLINIVLANFAYQLGEHVFSVYLLLIASIIIASDAPRLYDLLVRERPAKADHFEPAFKSRRLSLAVRVLFVLFGVFYTSITYAAHKKSNWPFPDTPGLADAAGVYNVREFSLNGAVHPYSATDSVRWQDVVFEKWNELSVKVNGRLPVDASSPQIANQPDDQRRYSSQGNGARIFYRYAVQNNNIQLKNVNQPTDIKVFRMVRPDSKTIVLEGTGADSSLHVVLDKLPKEYLLDKGRRKKVTVY